MAQQQLFKFVLEKMNDVKDSILESTNLSTTKPCCCKCKEVSKFKCSNCGVFYCSKTCQDRDWVEHYVLCVQKPPLVEIDAQQAKTAEKNAQHLQKQLRMLAIACEDFAKQLGNSNSEIGDALRSDSNGVTDNLPIQKLIPTVKDDQVIIVCFGTLNKVFVCPESNYAAYCEVIRKVEEYGTKAPLFKRMPEKHSFVLCTRHGRFSRAKVLHPLGGNPHQIRVSYIDYGNFSTRRLTNLYEINLEIADLPIHIAEVTLKNVTNITLGAPTWQSVLNAFERKSYRMQTHRNGEVELFETVTGDSLNEKIMAIVRRKKEKSPEPLLQNDKNQLNSPESKRPRVQFTEPVEKQEKENKKVALPRVMSAPFVTNVISRAERNVKAIVVDTSMIEYGYVACILKKYAKEFNDLQVYIKQTDFESGEPYFPEKGEYVIAEYQGDWFRGQVVDVHPNGKNFDIFYVDFLNQETVGSQKIRHYPDDLTIACNTQLCYFSGLPKKSTPQIKMFLKNEIKVMDKILIDRVVDLDDEVALVECRQLLDRMLEKNLI